jgi:MSHA biogenesis protein MshQ
MNSSITCVLRWLGTALIAAAGVAHAATYSYQPTSFAWETPTNNVVWERTNTGYPIDDDKQLVNIGFTFTFGGVGYTQVRVFSNGILHFGADQGFHQTYTNTALPASGADRFIAAYWDDLQPRSGGTVRYETFGTAPNRRFVASWDALPHYSDAGLYSVQIILYENGTFKFQYGGGATAGGSATIGVEVSNSDYTEYSFNTSSVTNGTALLFFQGAMAEYAMEQTSWSGAGSILDTSGNGNHANPVGTPSTQLPTPATPPSTCRAGNFASNTSTGTITAIDTGMQPDARMARSGTISFWYKSNVAWNASSSDRQLFDATTTNNRWFFLTKRASGALRFVVTDSSNNTYSVETGGNSTAANTWVHVAVSWSFGSNARIRVYINGVQQATANTSTNRLSASIDTLYFGDNRSGVTGSNGTGNSSDGQIDEVRIYTNERTATEIQADMNTARACVIVNDYAITYPGGTTGLTCEPAQVTFGARDASGSAVAPSAGTTLTITTSTGAGFWETPAVSGSGTWTPSGSNNGQATYTWPGGETSFTVRLRQTTPATININVTDSGSRTEGASVDPSITFANAAFRITGDGTTAATIGTHIAGKDSNVGFGAQTLFLQAIRTDTNTGSCTTAFQNQTVNVELASQCNNPSGCTPTPGNTVSVRNSSNAMIAIGQNNGGSTPTNYTAVALAFDAQSKAPLIFNYADAGQLTLLARYALPSPPSGQYMSGSSTPFVVRPFGLRIGVTGPGTGLSGASSTPTIVAGNNFNVTLTAVAWKTGDDADADGQPDSQAQIAGNLATPNFGLETISSSAIVSHALSEPVGGSAGGLTGTTFSGFANGVRTQAMTYSEVGIINLLATSTSYLGSGQDVTAGTSGLTGVGRFIPNQFALSSASLANRVASSCAPASVFSYMDEGLGLTFTLTAQNAAGATTTNYRGSFARLPLTAAGLNFGARDIASNTNLSARLDTSSGVTGSWGNGVANGLAATIAIRRQLTPDNPDGPFNQVKLGIAPADPDGVALAAAALDFDVDGVGGNDRAQIGANTQIRFGRLRVQNALGSERIALPVAMQIEYWNGAGFLVNTLDSCTSLPRSAVSLGAYQVNLNACETAFSVATVVFTNGVATAALAAPGSANNGSVELRVNLGSVPGGAQYCAGVGGAPLAAASAARSYLRGRWNATDDDANANTNYDDDPVARATFGVYGTDRAPNRLIYLRENY